MFDVMIWSGAALSLVGLAGLVWCIIQVARARRSGLDDDALRAAVQSVLPLNLGSLFLSMIGLILVTVGVILA